MRGPLEGNLHPAAFFLRGAAVYLLYLDDSGSVGNVYENHFVLAGVSVFERQIHWLSKELEDLARSVHPQAPDALEFHASGIRSGKRQPWKGMPREDRRKVIGEVLGILARSHESTCAFACAVHKPSFPGSDPVELAFEELCNRFDLLLKRKYASDDNPQRGLIIIDKTTYETSLQELARGFRSLGTRWGVVRNMCDVPFFVDSKASRLVQLADHVAYAVYRYYERGDDTYLSIIRPRFDREGDRLHGLVHRQTRLPQCKCPACLSRRTSERAKT